MPGIVPVLFGALRIELSVVLVPLALMLLITPSVPLLSPVTLVWGLLRTDVPGAVGLRVEAGFAPSSRLPFACA